MEGLQQGYNPISAAAYGTPFGQQGVYGGGYVPPLGGLIGSGIPGLMSHNIGRQHVPGQAIDGLGGLFQGYNALDPTNAVAVQTAQLAQQAYLAQLAQLAQQQQLAQLAQQAHLAQQAQQQGAYGRWSPFGLQQPQPGAGSLAQFGRIDPITAAYVQQAQVAQLCQQLAQQAQFGHQGPFGQNQFSQNPLGQGQFGQGWPGGQTPYQNPWQNPQLGSQFGRTLPFLANPLQAGMIGVY